MTLPLISRLIQSLEKEGISYCHWKGNATIEKALSGVKDLDILVAEEDKERFISILSRLNFIRVISSEDSWFPPMRHCYGYDAVSDKMVHVHVHYELILGFDLIKNYHLPVEQAFLQSAACSSGLKTPASELELIVFVIRMVLSCRPLLLFLGRHPRYLFKALFGKGPDTLLKSARRNELDYLLKNTDREKLKKYRHKHFHFISDRLFDYCLSSIFPNGSFYTWLMAGLRLRRVLKPYRRHSSITTMALTLQRCFMMRMNTVFCLLGWRRPQRKWMEHGGKIIAFVGGDGAGKTTGIREVKMWFGKYFNVRTIHMGKPPKGVLWYFALILLGIRRFVFMKPKNNFHQSLIYCLVARYRYRAFRRAMQLRSNGALVCLDRMPLPEMKHMDKPRIRELTGGRGIYAPLIRIEEGYYARIKGADE
ncbi:MAG: hypothetical protein ACYSSI_13110, partial [Planctomycetota bacterium]